ncbi:hypothetical protein [Sulfurivermis fontis]|uniref:hypothetical protein n=1 Tax=Sulfurivermis fontis TaxID=1972068 RepID=UPI000FDABD0B|nr:hypothetical protein [Sulfurivermis fontis]
MKEQQNSTEEAMNRVLEAERAALAAIAECTTRAANLIEAAQQQARRIHRRTDSRISQVHAHCALALGRQVELLLQQEAENASATVPDAVIQEVLAAAVERLAQSLTDDAAGDD